MGHGLGLDLALAIEGVRPEMKILLMSGYSRFARGDEPAELLLANAPAVLDVITSQRAVSSDATKGLGFVPDYQPLLAWNDAEERRRSGGS